LKRLPDPVWFGCTNQQFTESSAAGSGPFARAVHQLNPIDLSGKEICIQGYSVLTTLEDALSVGEVIRGLDGCLRGMASGDSRYRQAAEMLLEIELLLESLLVE
jgi:hypothetical protein